MQFPCALTVFLFCSCTLCFSRKPIVTIVFSPPSALLLTLPGFSFPFLVCELPALVLQESLASHSRKSRGRLRDSTETKTTFDTLLHS